MADFPPLGFKTQHSKYYSIEFIDQSMSAEMEGGYMLTRPRTNSRPKRRFTTGWINLSQSEMEQLNDFQHSRRLTVRSFNYTLPTTGEVVTVRFEKPIKFSYNGRGNNFRYEATDIIMREV